MHCVSTVICRSGAEDAVVYVVCDSGCDTRGDNLVVRRNSAGELFAAESEHQLTVSFESQDEWDPRNMLRDLRYNRDHAVITLDCGHVFYQLDISRIAATEVDAMWATYKRMGCDFNTLIDRDAHCYLETQMAAGGPEHRSWLSSMTSELVIYTAGAPILAGASFCLNAFRPSYLPMVPEQFKIVIHIWLPLLLLAMAFGCIVLAVTVPLRKSMRKSGKQDADIGQGERI